jgi:hypothetical protein
MDGWLAVLVEEKRQCGLLSFLVTGEGRRRTARGGAAGRLEVGDDVWVGR